jgi:threonine dehydrogenase-like Zn-dependent dehydrogenase
MALRAVTRGPGDMVVESVDAGRAPDGAVLVGVEAVGVCGSDLRVYSGEHPYLAYPVVQGHEVAGVVVRAVPGGPAPGTRVVVDPLAPCGSCRTCRTGHPNACERLEVLGIHRAGGLASFLAVDPGRVHPVGDLPPRVAVLVEPLAVALHALRRGGVAAGSDVLVLGAGSIGRSVALGAVAAGARVVVVDRFPVRLRLVEALGAETAAVDDAPGVVAVARGRFEPPGPAVVVHATGSAGVLAAAYEAVAPAGTVVVIGVSTEDVTVPLGVYTRKELTVVGSRNSNGEFPEAITLARRHVPELARWVSHVFPLARAPEAFRYTIDNTDVVTKTVVSGEG